MISGETDIPDEVEEETRYYARAISRDQSLTRAMLDFHNLYVKFNLINSVASHLSLSTSDTKLLDLACGKAGDLSKWIQDYHIKTVVGVDVSQDNIENPRDGACVRYHEKKMKTLKYRGDKAAFPHMYFLVGDSSLDLASGAASKSALTPESREEYRKLFQILWGKTVQRSPVLNELQQNMMGIIREASIWLVFNLPFTISLKTLKV